MWHGFSWKSHVISCYKWTDVLSKLTPNSITIPRRLSRFYLFPILKHDMDFGQVQVMAIAKKIMGCPSDLVSFSTKLPSICDMKWHGISMRSHVTFLHRTAKRRWDFQSFLVFAEFIQSKIKIRTISSFPFLSLPWILNSCKVSQGKAKKKLLKLIVY